MKVNGEELVFGLDIGTRNVVGMVGYRQGERFVVVAQEIREHQTRAMLDGQIHDINRVAATIAGIREALEERTGIKLEEVCIAAAGRVLKTMNVHVEMELDKERNVTKDDISALASMGVEQAVSEFQEKNDTGIHFYCVGYSVMRYDLNGMWMGQPEHHKARKIGADMIATFLPDDVVDGLYSAVELAGLKVANLTLEPIAAIRVAIPEKFRLLNIAMIDVGAGTSDISITSDGCVVAFGMLPNAGDSLTEILAKACLIDFATAEKLKVTAAQKEKIMYEDIMGIEQTITADEIVAICQPEIERMAKLTAEKIKELNGGKSPSAVFIVGGGGKIAGFDKNIAAELGLDPKRVALRGEEILKDVDFPDGALRDSTIITPIGICLTYYEQNNNFIYITFNGDRIKLYDNNKLTVMDAAMQASFNREALFPRRGKELHYTVNGKNRVTRGEYGESAHIYLNGEEVNLNCGIKSNDDIVIEGSTPGQDAVERVSGLVDYNGKIVLYINGDEMQLPKPVRVNGAAAAGDYAIQDKDAVEIVSYYTKEGFFAFMGLSMEDMVLFVNGEEADSDTMICGHDKLEVKSLQELREQEEQREKEAKLELEMELERKAAREAAAQKAADQEAVNREAADQEATDQETAAQKAAAQEAVKEQYARETGTETPRQSVAEGNTAGTSAREDAVKEEPDRQKAAADAGETSGMEQERVKTVQDPAQLFDAMKENAEGSQTDADGSKKIIVIVNQQPVVMRGKKSYMFVDIFDYIDFDTSKMRGSGIATLVNGKDAQYTQELFNGDKVEVYWKE